jgi:hypothetical protein
MYELHYREEPLFIAPARAQILCAYFTITDRQVINLHPRCR